MILDPASQVQVDAANPDRSTWLSANAGSGKTRVLTDRVARLLLRGALPQNILCLTYTKAAAAEMQNRLFRTLGEWAMFPDADLVQALARIGESDRGDLTDARTLFARAIETPGGLRIQTIHSFCASILRQFPIEAGVTPNFRELEADEAQDLLQQALEDMARDADPRLTSMLACHGGDDIAALLAAIATERTSFGRRTSVEDIAKGLGLTKDTSAGTLKRELARAGAGGWWVKVGQALLGQSKTNADVGERMIGVDFGNLSDADIAAFEKDFLYADGANSKAGKFPRGNAAKAVADWQGDLDHFMEAVLAHRRGRHALECRDATATLHAFAVAILDRYEELKRRHGVLDFDDLIARTARLLGDATRDWVRYRLDGRIEHILVDEAQDTSPTQWEVISALADEITAGEGASARERSLFVVGDRKQSIYSFQGADAEGFDRMSAHFQERLRHAQAPLQVRELLHSFRSSPAILRATDSVFAALHPDAIPIRHDAFFADLPGRVDVWPTITPPEKPDAVAWYDPVDRPLEDAAQIQLADKVAHEIKRLIGDEFIPRPNGSARRIQPGDILVLVQKRGPIFDRIIKTAQTIGVDIAGPDRLRISEELAVRDVLSLLRFLALPEDDLALAEALKSPLFGWSEQQLFSLAQGRTSRSLWPELRRRAGEFGDTVEMLTDLRDRSDFLRPFELIERILIEDGGRRRFLARLGPDAEDALDELLALALRFEASETPDLTSFLGYMERQSVETKRSSETAGSKVRVMTVHGAKGLEAPVVILPDTIRVERAPDARIFSGPDGTPYYSMPSTLAPIAQGEAKSRRAAADRAERERLLYVAMTRAETWLIVCGAEMRKKGGFWHDAVAAGLAVLPGVVPVDTPSGEGQRLEHGTWPTSAEDEPPKTKPEPEMVAHFDPLKTPVREQARINPSKLGGAKALAGEPEITGDGRARGTALHLLLEHLPDIDPAARSNAARSLLANARIDIQSEALVAEALDIISAFPDIFEGDALREVPIAGVAGGLAFDGTIDVLKFEGDQIRLIDFKSNGVVPTTPEGVPEGILRQMGAYLSALEVAYPGMAITLEILWTTTASCMVLPHAIVREAFARHTTS